MIILVDFNSDALENQRLDESLSANLCAASSLVEVTAQWASLSQPSCRGWHQQWKSRKAPRRHATIFYPSYVHQNVDQCQILDSWEKVLGWMGGQKTQRSRWDASYRDELASKPSRYQCRDEHYLQHSNGHHLWSEYPNPSRPSSYINTRYGILSVWRFWRKFNWSSLNLGFAFDMSVQLNALCGVVTEPSQQSIARAKHNRRSVLSHRQKFASSRFQHWAWRDLRNDRPITPITDPKAKVQI